MNVIAATAEGYAFPTNLDHDQRVGGMAPPTQAELLVRALADDLLPDRLETELAAQAARRRSPVERPR